MKFLSLVLRRISCVKIFDNYFFVILKKKGVIIFLGVGVLSFFAVGINLFQDDINFGGKTFSGSRYKLKFTKDNVKCIDRKGDLYCSGTATKTYNKTWLKAWLKGYKYTQDFDEEYCGYKYRDVYLKRNNAIICRAADFFKYFNYKI